MIVQILLCLGFQNATEDGIGPLVELLRSDRIERRAEALAQLKRLGDLAVPSMERLRKDPDPELAHRAEYLLRFLDLRRQFSPPLKSAFPDLEDRLLQPEGRGWPEVFLEAVSAHETIRRHPHLKDQDLLPLACNALRFACGGREKLDILSEIVRRDLRSAVTEVVALLDHEDREDLSRIAFSTVVLWRASEATPRLLELCAHEDSMLRSRGVWALGQMRPSACLSVVTSLLKDPDPGVRCAAIRAWCLLRVNESCGILFPLLADSDVDVRRTAIIALGQCGDGSSTPALVPFLSVSQPLLRAASVEALGRLGAAVSAQLQTMAGDSDPLVRKALLGAVCRLGGEGVGALLQQGLKDGDRDVRAVSASLLCRRGDAQGLPILIGQRQSLHEANTLRSPEAWTRISTAPVPRDIAGPPLHSLGALARGAGINLQISAALVSKIGAWQEPFHCRPGEAAPDQFLDAVLRILDTLQSILEEPLTVILEKEDLKIVGVGDAAAFWESWRKDQERGGNRR